MVLIRKNVGIDCGCNPRIRTKYEWKLHERKLAGECTRIPSQSYAVQARRSFIDVCGGEAGSRGGSDAREKIRKLYPQQCFFADDQVLSVLETAIMWTAVDKSIWAPKRERWSLQCAQATRVQDVKALLIEFEVVVNVAALRPKYQTKRAEFQKLLKNAKYLDHLELLTSEKCKRHCQFSVGVRNEHVQQLLLQ